jgi:PAS domain S-box-containing protein
LDHCRHGLRETQQFEFIRKDGTKIYSRVELSQTTDTNGEYVGAVLYVMDITDLKRAESALKDSEARFFALAENSPNMIFINRMGRVIYANKKFEEILGFKKEELYSPYFDFFNVIAPESRESTRENFRRLMKGENINPFKLTFITKNDKRIDALLATEVIDDAGEKATLGIIINSNTF